MTPTITYRTAVLIPGMICVLTTLVRGYVGAQSYIPAIEAGVKSIQHNVQTKKDNAKEGKEVDEEYAIVASIEGKPATADLVGRTLQAADIPADILGSRV